MCFLSSGPHFFVSLDNGLSLKHVLKEPVHKDHLPIKTTFFLSPLGGLYRQVSLYVYPEAVDHIFCFP